MADKDFKDYSNAKENLNYHKIYSDLHRVNQHQGNVTNIPQWYLNTWVLVKYLFQMKQVKSGYR